MSEIIRGVTFEGSKDTQLFDQMITSTIENATYENMGQRIMNELYFTDTTILGEKQEFGDVDPGNGLFESGELEKAKEVPMSFGNTKGVYQKIYKGKISVTGVFYDWMKSTESLEGANTDIQAKMLEKGKEMQYLLKNGEKTKAQIVTKVITEWESSNAANWPGSLTNDGQPLFSTVHPIARTGTTQSNLVTAAIGTDAEKLAALETAVNLLRNMRLNNGDFCPTDGGFVLKTTIQGKLGWTRALNAEFGKSGQGTNSEAVNIFTVQGFDVTIEALETLTTYDTDGNIIGDATSAYLMNPKYLREYEALKGYTIKPLTVVTDKIKDPRSYVALAEMLFGADHYNAQRGIVKIKST